jgi:hypothetical protein
VRTGLLVICPSSDGDPPHSKVNDWDESDDEDTAANLAKRFNRIVVLARMFSIAQLEEDPALLLDLKEDVREECEAIGKVTNVVLYDVRPAVRRLPRPSQRCAHRKSPTAS